MRTLLIDNYDSFTYILRDYILTQGSETQVMRNNDPDLRSVDLSQYDAIVISPGPSKPHESGNLMTFLERSIYNLPVLGICLGHQAIGQFFGSSLVKARKPIHGKTCLITSAPDPIFLHVPKQFHATRYHSLVLESIKLPLEIIAHSDSGEVMAVRHTTLPIRGIQFHPESCKTQFGTNIIKNFLSLANGKS